MPCRLRDLVKRLRKHGIRVEKPRSGSHGKLCREGYRSYPLPAGHGMHTEISNAYIAALCRHFGIDRSDIMGK